MRMPSDFTIAGSRFPLRERTLELAGTRFRYATVPYTPENLEGIARSLGLSERAWPYWLEDWPATWALASLLAGEDPARWPGPVLDLGCGAGILGAWLRARFGVEPFACDFNSDACRLAARNAAANGGDPARGRVVCADLRAFPLRRRFGLVLAGEMLYARENQAPILAFLAAHLAPGGRCLLADKGRSAAEGFAGAARAAGFAVALRATEAEGRPARAFELRAGPP
jgi:SAM-dependent methyltransferase